MTTQNTLDKYENVFEDLPNHGNQLDWSIHGWLGMTRKTEPGQEQELLWHYDSQSGVLVKYEKIPSNGGPHNRAPLWWAQDGIKEEVIITTSTFPILKGPHIDATLSIYLSSTSILDCLTKAPRKDRGIKGFPFKGWDSDMTFHFRAWIMHQTRIVICSCDVGSTKY